MHKAQHSKLICNEKQIKNEHRIYKEWREEIFFSLFSLKFIQFLETQKRKKKKKKGLKYKEN